MRVNHGSVNSEPTVADSAEGTVPRESPNQSVLDLSSEAQPRPFQRNPLQMALGRYYYSIRRYGLWYLSNNKLASERTAGSVQRRDMSHQAATHATPLLRSLRGVDVQLQLNKVHNLRLAIARLDGVIVHPGETLSLWKVIGKPPRRKGYKPGMVLVNGGFKAGVGGGLCQLSNLIYWLTLHTPLTVTERYRHQYDVFPDSNRTLPFGSGATISYNYIDLQICNHTDEDFNLRLHLSESELVGTWFTTRPLSYHYVVYEKNPCITQETGGRYIRHNEIWKDTINESEHCVESERVTHNHALMMYSPLLPAAEG